MLCHEVEVDMSLIRQNGLDGPAATVAYRKAIVEQLKKLMIRGFVAERKWDGTRVLAISEDAITLQNRNGVIYSIRLPEVIKALQAFHGHWILDGEVVVIDSDGEEKFTACQRRCSTHYPDPLLRQQFPVKMEVFDILQADGKNMEKEPYLNRKECLLENFFADEDGCLQDCPEETIQYVQFETDLRLAWTEAVRKNREGLITKQIESPYEHERSYSWLKVKNWLFEVCNVVGYTVGENARNSFFGSLVLADENGRYRGCVGSGFNEWELRKTKDQLSDSPKPLKASFSYEQVGEPYRAISTNLQVLVKYYQTTAKNVMRMPIFIISN